MSLDQACDLRGPLEALADTLLPPPEISVSEWAREYFRLSSEYSAVTGNFDPYAYQIEPLDCLSPFHPSDFMVLMCAAQMMKTLTMLIFLGYVIDVDPGPVLVVQPSAEDAKSFSKERIAPMITEVPRVAAKVIEAKSRDSGNTIDQKRFRGGQVSITGAISPRGLRRRSIRYLLLDEIDGYEPTQEGDPVSLAIMRTETFWNRKIVLCSTPTEKGSSRIATFYGESDQRKFFVPCPRCGHEQILLWAGVRWGDIAAELDAASGMWIVSEQDGQPGVQQNHHIDDSEAHFCCESCRALIPHHRKTEMLRGGRWIAMNPEGRYPGFWISRVYSPDRSWGYLVTEKFLPAKNDPEALQTFINTVLAEEWAEQGETPDWEKLKARSEDYEPGIVPAGALVLTCGIDVQRNWLAYSVWGFGRNRERWLVDHQVLEGNTAQPEVWERLTERMQYQYPHVLGGSLGITKIAIDTGDEQYNSEALYGWIRKMGPSLVMAIKGYDHGESLVGLPRNVESNPVGKLYKRGVKIWPINVSMAKARLYAQLNFEKSADGGGVAGAIHYPWMDDEWYKQLASEQFTQPRLLKGKRKKGGWEKTRERNEALDTTNYAGGAGFVLKLHERPESYWAAIEIFLGVGVDKEKEPVERQPARPPTPESVASAPRQPQGNSWFGGVRRGSWMNR